MEMEDAFKGNGKYDYPRIGAVTEKGTEQGEETLKFYSDGTDFCP